MWENNNSNNKSKKIDNEIIKRNIIGIFIGYIKNHRKKIKLCLFKKTAYGSFLQLVNFNTGLV